MRKGTQQGGGGKSGGQLRHWLERMVREKVQEFIQEILEDEVTRFLGGRAKSQRRASVGAAGGVTRPAHPSPGNRRRRAALQRHGEKAKVLDVAALVGSEEIVARAAVDRLDRATGNQADQPNRIDPHRVQFGLGVDKI